eukprot:9279966-Prorocentrum_lima.AAC.1
MTSSLVGSEMCIRDRPQTSLRWTQRSRPVIASNFLALDTAPMSCYCPVSYTHLTLPTICSV